jgi:hypothetical protein
MEILNGVETEGNITLDSTDLAAINAEVDTALNTAIPASNTANSVNDVLLDQLKPNVALVKAVTDKLIPNTGVFYADPDTALDTGAGNTIATAKKWTDSAIGLCTDASADVIIRLPGNENIDDDDTDPAIVCDIKGMTIQGIGGGNPEQKSEVNCSIRRRQNSGWGAAAGAAIEIQKPCSLIGLEVVAVAQPGILISGEGGGEAGAFALVKGCRFVGWGLMTEAIHFDAGTYNKIENCVFEELTAGIFLDSTASNNPDFNDIVGCRFAGCTYGIDTDTGVTAHNTRVIGCEFAPSHAGAMTYAIRTRNLWDSGVIAKNKFGCTRANAYDQTVATLRTAGVKVFGNEYLDGTDEELDKKVDPTVGSTTANWNTATGTSGEAGEDLVTIGADNTKYKLLGLWLDVSACTNGALLTVKMFTQINGTERKVYSQSFLVNTDPDGLWIVQGVLGIHEALRVEVYSGTSESVAIGYDYMLEAM